MLSRLFPNPRYYGWRIAALGLLCSALSSPGQSFALSLYLEHLIADLGVSRLEISSIYGGATVLAAFALPWVGAWADRLPSGRFLAGVLALLGAAQLAFSQVHALWALALGFFALRLLGQGAIGLGTITATVRWFARYRGRALAIVALGYAAGEMIFPRIIDRLIGAFGWRGSMLTIGSAYLLLFAPLVWRALRERRPETEPMDGDRIEGGAAQAWVPGPSWGTKEAVRAPIFWALLACLCVPPLVHTAVIFHQVALFASSGWEPGLVARAFSAFAAGGMIATYGTGMILERIPSRFGVAISLGLLAAGLAVAVVQPAWSLAPWIYYGVLGLSAGAGGAANSMVWPGYFGTEALGSIKGVVNAFRNGSTAAGPPLAALLAGPEGSFVVVASAGLGLALAAAVVAALLPASARLAPAAAQADG